MSKFNEICFILCLFYAQMCSLGFIIFLFMLKLCFHYNRVDWDCDDCPGDYGGVVTFVALILKRGTNIERDHAQTAIRKY